MAPPPLPDLQALRNLVNQERARMVKLPVEPGSTPCPSVSRREALLALAALQVEKARDYREADPGDRASAEQCVADAARLLEHAAGPGFPDFVRAGLFREQAYFARCDGSPQPYYLYLPEAYDGSSAWPLVVVLHGWVPGTCRTKPWLVPGDVARLADKHRTLLAMPHGRTNTDFQYAGEVDVLRVLEEVCAFYRVDRDRVYLLGPSMGGAGAWQIAAHYPDLFAAAAPINAQADWFRFWRELYRYPARGEMPRHWVQLMAANNPLDLALNLSALPTYSQHATGCFVGAVHSRDMAARLQRLGAPHTFFEDPSPLGHYIYWALPCWERAFEQLMQHRRMKDPATVRYTTRTLRYPGTHGVVVKSFERWCEPATVEARRLEDGSLVISSTNVAALALEPPAAPGAGAARMRVRWNGRAMAARPAPSGTILLRAPGVEPTTNGLRKSSAVCGPAADVFSFPFVVARGTAGTAEETDALQRLARGFAADWHAYAEGRVRVLRDTEVTAEMMARTGLVLCGAPHSNTLLKRMAPDLPFRIERDAVVLPDGKRFPSRNTGLVLTYPNPLASGRYILILNGLPWGQRRANNHKFDLLPDFAIFTAETLPHTNVNRFLAAGFFDTHWRYDPALTDFAD